EGAERTKNFTQAQAAAQALEDPGEKATALDTANALQESQAAKQLRSEIPALLESGFGIQVWRRHLIAKFPRFLYFDEYYQMTGQVNVEKLKERETADKLEHSDRPMLGLIELARMNLDELLKPQNTQAL